MILDEIVADKKKDCRSTKRKSVRLKFGILHSHMPVHPTVFMRH